MPFFKYALGLFLLLAASPVLARELVLEHRFGQTRLDPETIHRVVSVGYHEQDFLYSLGIAPVGVHEWFGDYPYATWPWAEAARKALGAEPEVQKGTEIDVEWVWSMHPDLIVATYAPMDQRLYDQLSQIAPVIGPPAGYPDWEAPWDVELELIAKAVGREDKARAVIADLDAKISEAAAKEPQLAGLSGSSAFFYNGQIFGYPSGAGANRVMDAFGLKTPARFDALSDGKGQFSVSPERLDLFDLDVVLWLVDAPTRQAVMELPVWRGSRMAREGRAIWASREMMGAMSFQSPLSTAWALGALGPAFAAAADGDPATVAPMPEAAPEN